MSMPGWALVTGASSGIGEQFARALARRKQNLILVARSQEKLETLARVLPQAFGVQAEAFPCDLSSAGAGDRLARSVLERGRQISLLVNNAGFGARGEFWKLPLERQMDMIRLHLAALIELSHHFLPGMVERREGGIINVSSMTGFQPIPYVALYAATKASMTSFSMALAEELRPYGVRVVTLCPGGTRTNFVIEGSRAGRGRFPVSSMAPEEVVAQALARLDEGGGMVVPGWFNRLGIFIERFVPRPWVPWAVAKMSRP
jgi:short-subunit dehydrogenase